MAILKAKFFHLNFWPYYGLWYSKVIVVLWQILLKNHVAGEGEAPAMFHDLTTH